MNKENLHILRGTIRKDTIQNVQADGSVVVTVRMAQVGVREYSQWIDNGEYSEYKKSREALLPEHLFSKETLESAKGVLVTYYHPWRLLDPDNWDIYAKGVTIGEPRVEDNKFLTMDVKIFDKELQAYVLSGVSDGCSIGFTQTFVPEPGEIDGETYDGYNANIRLNHLAFCDREDARGGVELGVKLDTIDKIAVDTTVASKAYENACQYRVDTQNNNNKKQGGETMEVRLDGKVFDVDSAVAARIDTLEKENGALKAQVEASKELQTRIDAITGERDAARADITAKEAKIAELQARVDAAPTEEGILKAVGLAGFVSKLTGEEESYKTDSKELMLKALTKMYPNEKFDTKSEAYLEARMDVLKESLERDGYPTVSAKDPEAKDTDTRVDTLGIDNFGRAANHFSMKK